jgi:hypothetical protein
MDQLHTSGTFDPAAKAILLRALNFDFWLITSKKAHYLNLFE